MKKTLFFFLALFWGMPLLAEDVIEQRTLSPFHTIIVENNFLADFEIAPEYTISITADSQSELVKTVSSVINDTLFVNYSETLLKSVIVKITAPSVDFLWARQMAKIHIKNPLVLENQLRISLSGTGSMYFNQITCKNAHIHFNGVGQLVAEGDMLCDSMFVKLNGTCSANFENVICQALKVQQAGGSGCYINKDLKCNQLEAITNGAGTFQAEQNVIANHSVFLAMHGAGSSVINGDLTTSTICAEMFGTGKVAVEHLTADTVNAKLKGVGNIILGGQTKVFIPSAAGLGAIRSKDLVVKP